MLYTFILKKKKKKIIKNKKYGTNKKGYKNMCRDAGLPVYEPLLKQLTNDEDREEFLQTQQVNKE